MFPRGGSSGFLTRLPGVYDRKKPLLSERGISVFGNKTPVGGRGGREGEVGTGSRKGNRGVGRAKGTLGRVEPLPVTVKPVSDHGSSSGISGTVELDQSSGTCDYEE